jgi:hypothetical protein
LLRCSLEIEALCRRCQVAEKQARPTSTPRQPDASG